MSPADGVDVVILGGGAAGLAAAVAAGRAGARVAVLERMPRPGKKILITGGGRCNLLNENLDPGRMTSSAPGLAAAVWERYGRRAIEEFFAGLGLPLTAEAGRVYPATNQAASVLRVLELELRRLGVPVELEFEAVSAERRAAGFAVVSAGGRRIEGRTAVLAAGGKCYPALGSNGSGYALAQRLGHRIVPPVPSAVPLLVKDKLCHPLQGQRLRARATALVDGAAAATAEGDLLFTSYGLSGTAVLDVSEPLSLALNREPKKRAALAVDFVPLLTRDALGRELLRRMEAGWPPADWGAGLLPEKLSAVLPGWTAGTGGKPEDVAAALAAALKDKHFPVSGTRGWNEAEFTAGGVDAREVDPRTLESTRCPGLFLAGEILDIQGPRGGFNLAWAWASGLLAGQAAAAASKS